MKSSRAGAMDGVADLDPADLRLQRHTAGYLLAKLVPAAATFAGILVMTRLLNQGQYGVFVLVLAATFTLAQVASQWLQQAVLRFLPGAARSEAARSVDSGMAAGLLLITLVSLLCFVPAMLVAGRMGGGPSAIAPYLPVSSVLMLSTLTFNTLQTYLNAQLTPDRYALHTGLNALLRFALPLVAVMLVGASAEVALLAVALSYVVGVIPMAWEVHFVPVLCDGLRERRTTLAWLRAAARYGGPMVGWFISLQVLVFSDRFVLTVFAGAAVVGLYAATYDLFNRGLYLAADAVNLALRPLVMRSAEAHDPDRTRSLLSSGIRLYLLASVPLVTAAAIWRGPIVELLLPSDYWAGARIVPFIMLGFLAWHVGGYLQQMLEARRQTNLVFAAAAIAAVANAGLNLLLIPRYGYIAGAYTTLAAYLAFLAAIAVACGRETWCLVPWRSVGRLLVAGGVMAAILLSAPVELPARAHLARLLAYGAASLVAFGLVLAGLGEFSRSQLRQLRAATLSS